MPLNHTTRTGLFPTVINKEETQSKSAVKQKAKTTNTKTEKTPVVSILKRKSEVNNKRKSAPASYTPSTDRHVKFSSKASEQESLRVKLNSWLLAKGKTPSRCRHLMCFNEQVSAKKRKSQDRLVDRTITQNLLSEQLKVLKSEEPKKKLFDDGPSSAKKPRRSTEKENLQTRRSIRFYDETDGHASDVKKESESIKKTPTPQKESQSPMPDMIKAASSGSGWSGVQVLEHLNSMLEECLTLYDAGCPLDNLLPWLADIEAHVPRAITFAPYYICKAKVLSAFPQQVLSVFCQAVKNNAQPCDLLAQEMKSSLSLLMISPPSELPPISPSFKIGEESISAPDGMTSKSWAYSPSPACSVGRRAYTPGRRSNRSLSSSGSRLGDTSNSLGHLSCTESYGESSCTETDVSNGTFSILSESAASGRISSPFSSSRCSTPLDQLRSSIGNVSQGGNPSTQHKPTPVYPDTVGGSVSKSGAKKMGSTVKYVIGSATPLLKNVAEASPAVAVVTPVRRSSRLSGRQLTPGVVLRREIASVSDLSETERQTMLFQTNPAITEN